MTSHHDDSAARTIQSVATGLYRTQALYVATKLGIADLLHGRPRTATELAAEVGVQADPLARVLRYLTSLGVFRQLDGGQFANNSASEQLCIRDPGSMGDLALLFGEEFYEAWGNLLEAVRTGQDAFSATFGCGLFEYLERNPSRGRAFDRAMAGGSTFFAALPDVFDFAAFEQVVDVGGGNGAALAEVLSRHRQLTGVLFDAAAVLEGARSGIEERSLAGRCELVPGDFFQSVPPGDVYLLSRVLHDWTDPQCVRVLRNVRHSIKAGGRLLVAERLLPGPLALGADLNMLAVTQGRERSRDEFADLFAHAGFRLVEVVELPLEVYLLVAEPVAGDQEGGTLPDAQ